MIKAFLKDFFKCDITI